MSLFVQSKACWSVPLNGIQLIELLPIFSVRTISSVVVLDGPVIALQCFSRHCFGVRWYPLAAINRVALVTQPVPSPASQSLTNSRLLILAILEPQPSRY
ncbi:hypothetical protein ATANTOWER_024695 [Ataeniobius toweri]|uniref:Uncharacterized protein n=1 Tax=Ataeniobius toweri TaxID=208326 RepID=A0ABU7AA09_9TELE|nr:hypothetical protein [Ataeniobius toweri]